MAHHVLLAVEDMAKNLFVSLGFRAEGTLAG
jgi:hypothetical protein